jgi:hypothetical protein
MAADGPDRAARGAAEVSCGFEAWCLPPAYRGGHDPDPERAVHGGDPCPQAKAAQPPDLRILVDRAGAAIDQNAPSRTGPVVIVVGLERHYALALSRGQFGPPGRAEDRTLAVHDVIDRQDHYLTIGEEADPSDRDCGKQLKTPVERQYLESCVIGWVVWHLALLLGWAGGACGGEGLIRLLADPDCAVCEPTGAAGVRCRPFGS